MVAVEQYRGVFPAGAVWWAELQLPEVFVPVTAGVVAEREQYGSLAVMLWDVAVDSLTVGLLDEAV